jgi:hypothetical protein
MAAAKRKEKKPIKTGNSSRHITSLKQSILETFDIYGLSGKDIDVYGLTWCKMCA